MTARPGMLTGGGRALSGRCSSSGTEAAARGRHRTRLPRGPCVCGRGARPKSFGFRNPRPAGYRPRGVGRWRGKRRPLGHGPRRGHRRSPRSAASAWRRRQSAPSRAVPHRETACPAWGAWVCTVALCTLLASARPPASYEPQAGHLAMVCLSGDRCRHQIRSHPASTFTLGPENTPLPQRTFVRVCTPN